MVPIKVPTNTSQILNWRKWMKKIDKKTTRSANNDNDNDYDNHVDDNNYI